MRVSRGEYQGFLASFVAHQGNGGALISVVLFGVATEISLPVVDLAATDEARPRPRVQRI